MALHQENPIFEMRALLDAFDGANPEDVDRFSELFEALQPKVIPELGNRLMRPSTPSALKHIIMQMAARFPNAEWTAFLERTLLHESDIDVFDEGCSTLAQFGTPDALESLKKLALSRGEPAFEAIITRELARADPVEAFAHHFGRMLGGSQNPRVAIEAADNLVTVAAHGSFEELKKACYNPDVLVARLALQVIASMADATAARFLLEHFKECHDKMLEDRKVLDLVGRLKGKPIPEAKPILMEEMREVLGPRVNENLSVLARIGEPGAVDPTPMLERLKLLATGRMESFLLSALGVLAEGKGARLSGLMGEVVESTKQRNLYYSVALERCATGMNQRVVEGLLADTPVLEALTESIRLHTARPAVAQVFGQLLDTGDTARLDLVLQSPDSALRKAAIVSLGQRRDPALMGFFFQAIEDPIQDNGLAAMEQLYRTPGSFQVLFDMLHSGQTGKVRQALAIFGHNRAHAAAESVLSVLEGAEREDLLLDALNALREIHYPAALANLLALLHPGANQRVQQALAETILRLGTPQAVRALREKAVSHNNSTLRLLALEGYGNLYSDPFHPVPADEVPGVQAMLDQCFEAREGWSHRFRVLTALEKIYIHDASFCEALRGRIQGFLEEQKTRAVWDHNQQNKASALARELAQRANRIKETLRRETDLAKLMGSMPACCGSIRTANLKALRDLLSTENLILSPEACESCLAFFRVEFFRPEEDWENLGLLSEAAGRFGHPEIVPLLHRLLLWAQEQASGEAVKWVKLLLSALKGMGLDEAQLEAMPSFRRAIFLDPSAFFRKRLMDPLSGRIPGLILSGASNRIEAEAMLEEPADLLVSELEDHTGELMEWLYSQYERRAIRMVVLSTASRADVDSEDCPWIRAVFRKPFAVEALVAKVEELAKE